MIGKINAVLLLANGLLGFLIASRFTLTSTNDPMSVRPSDVGTNSLLKQTKNEAPHADPTENRYRASSPAEINLTNTFLSFLSHRSRFPIDRAPFTPEKLIELGFDQKTDMVVSILNSLQKGATELEARFCNMSKNRLGESVLTLNVPAPVLSKFREDAKEALDAVLSAGDSEFLWRLAQHKLEGNLDAKSFSITRHTDAPSGEDQFVVHSLNELKHESIVIEPVNSTVLAQNFGHLLGNFNLKP